ncbi:MULTISPECIES: heme lyase CcmF/NrfE family subunit [Rhodobacterales]|jgi:cytochrome c-type biogenesis protein CcmF|uniref:C-type cytochrome biogenesis protein CcmF n=4 Tax=Celeribacter TaxID=875170 RepID=A0A291GJ16_9RHOB|nr:MULTISPECIES: heme lyase CcmF/NrfE family subunit [Rhodobacterales]AUJ65936.1 c-type cytochrome biogenesis protein CcmF [Aestuarium zhoushanense]OBR35879.1 heme lyase CcmF/NrfE family subunit [Donghicola sp. JL3646]APO87366.1 c-type cytochrome biogenesis protein CcmF [Marivivens sp. JLT3646]ATG50036.1 c-type cytochrome biogenesis protein CcmF [Celeribacter ethanolicus]AVW90156.1 heme lyase CcmF/NrfE family subunit [Celeribacter baekdonensis]|tara:strand:+ start:7612 stop:9612 length:2001 start_codon:yes stop_codon:yes gene_type:complete
MTPELGHFVLALALALALVQSTIPLFGAARGNLLWMRSARSTAFGQVVFVGLAFAALMRAFVVSDFTVLNVANNSHSLKPMIFKVAATWGSHEGSLLLWVFILTIFGAAVAAFGSNLPETLRARTLAMQAWISVGFLSFLLFTSNPFERVFPPPLDGADLNPLLQDIGLAMHPPLLYFGYVGFSIVFSFAAAALIEGRIDTAWARWVRPWTLAAWISLTAGIALGSWWAYYELGWGGWWFWDPVENVSFMPWLLGTALLHSAIVTEKRDAFKSWTILLAILTFSLSLLGTFVVRSGLLTSVHAFAVDPERGLYILGLLAISIGGSLALYAWRAPMMEGGGLFKPISREAGLLLNNLILATATGTVLFGTLYPLFLEAVSGDKISVGPPFFNGAFVPMMLPLVFVMGLGPFLSWKRADLVGVLQRVRFVVVLAVLATLAIWYFAKGGPVLAYLSILIALWLFFASLREWALRVRLFEVPLQESIRRARNLPRAAHGMTLAHAGVAVLMIGMIGSSVWKSEEIAFVEPGTSVNIAGFDVTFEGVQRVRGPNYIADQGTLRVERGGSFVTALKPERRSYPVAQSTTTESAIRSTLAGDLYASITEPSLDKAEESGAWTLRILYEPFVGLLWLGAAMLVIGGSLSLSDRRFRVGAPQSSKARSTKPVAAE